MSVDLDSDSDFDPRTRTRTRRTRTRTYWTRLHRCPNHDRLEELCCRGTISVEQSSCCSTKTGDDTTYFQETTEGLSVPHLMCWRTEGTFTTARRCCGASGILAPDTKLQTYLLTYAYAIACNYCRHSTRLLFALPISLFILAYSASFSRCTIQADMNSITDLMSTQEITLVQVHRCTGVYYTVPGTQT